MKQTINGKHYTLEPGADLCGANLSCANLYGVNLAGAHLRKANLAKADLHEVNLTGADLTEADLTGADFYGSTLSGVILTNAKLVGADFYGVDLSEVNLAVANLDVIRDDLWAILAAYPDAASGIQQSLIEGRINGAVYMGETACLIGTIATIKQCSYQDLALDIDDDRPALRWFLGIGVGDTPTNHSLAAITHEWINQWLKGRR